MLSATLLAAAAVFSFIRRRRVKILRHFLGNVLLRFCPVHSRFSASNPDIAWIRTRTRTNTIPYGTKANAAGLSGRACACETRVWSETREGEWAGAVRGLFLQPGFISRRGSYSNLAKGIMGARRARCGDWTVVLELVQQRADPSQVESYSRGWPEVKQRSAKTTGAFLKKGEFWNARGGWPEKPFGLRGMGISSRALRF